MYRPRTRAPFQRGTVFVLAANELAMSRHPSGSRSRRENGVHQYRKVITPNKPDVFRTSPDECRQLRLRSGGSTSAPGCSTCVFELSPSHISQPALLNSKRPP